MAVVQEYKKSRNLHSYMTAYFI